MEKTIQFTLNGKPTQLQVDGNRPLLWVLRADLGLTGAKYGCGEGLCGACTVIVGKEAVRSCLLTMDDVAGEEVLTIEGLANSGRLHPLQQAFIDEQALQCGFCVNGVIMTAKAFLDKNPNATDAEMQQALSGVLCRCFTHVRMFRAIRRYADGRTR